MQEGLLFPPFSALVGCCQTSMGCTFRPQWEGRRISGALTHTLVLWIPRTTPDWLPSTPWPLPTLFVPKRPTLHTPISSALSQWHWPVGGMERGHREIQRSGCFFPSLHSLGSLACSSSPRAHLLLRTSHILPLLWFLATWFPSLAFRAWRKEQLPATANFSMTLWVPLNLSILQKVLSFKSTQLAISGLTVS